MSARTAATGEAAGRSCARALARQLAYLPLCALGIAVACSHAWAEQPDPDDSYAHPSGTQPPSESERGQPEGEEAGERDKPDTHIPLVGDEFLPEKPRSGWAALPVAVYAPETKLGMGAFGSVFFRVGGASAETRPSSLSVVGLYTLRDQVITELIPEIYWDDERWHLWSRIDYRKYPNRLWAVGNRARDDSEERYLERRPRWQFRIGGMVVDRLYLYGHLEAQQMNIEEVEAGGLLERRELVGSGGGRTVGLGPGLAWDTRDHLLVPRGGAFHEAVVMSYQPALGSHYRYNVMRVNLRQYVPVTDETVLALQYYAELLEGEVPFYQLAQVGGQRLLRGYFEGRYRDKALMAVQVEYRFPLFWRFGAVAHAATGHVATSLPVLALDPPLWSVGGGLRVMLNTAEKLNLRADVGFGYDTWGVYVGIAEAY